MVAALRVLTGASLLWGCADPEFLSVGGPLAADGQSQAAITIDPGSMDPDQLAVRSSLGAVGPLEPAGDGAWRAWLTAGNVPGVADLWLERADVAAPALAVSNIELLPGTATSAQLHLHGPLSEGNATHAWHTDQAETWRVDLLWWTDHDYLYLPDLHGTVYEPEWRFGDPLITHNTGNYGPSFWEVIADANLDYTLSLDDSLPRNDTPSLATRMSRGLDDGPDAWMRATWTALPSRVRYPLLSGVGLTFSVWVPPDWDPDLSSIRVGLPMNSIELGLDRELLFVDRDDAFPVNNPAVVVIDVDWTPGAWTEVTVDLDTVAAERLPEGRDQTIRGLTLYVGLAGEGAAEAWLGGVRFWDTISGDDLMDAQRELLDTSLTGPVRHLVGRELSYSEGGSLHLTAFGRAVPFMHYGPMGGVDRYSGGRFIGVVHAAGGIAAMTHPFGVSTQLIGDTAEGLAAAAAVCDVLDQKSIFGADMIEVGYVERGYDLEAHLALWDCLSARGHVITGIGTSDSHHTNTWASLKNRAVTWILAHGDDEAALMDALAAGRAFFGDPLIVDADRALLDLRIDGAAAMGQVLAGLPPAPVVIEAALGPVEEGDQLRWVVDGEVVSRDSADQSPAISVTPGTWTVARAELRSAGGDLKLASNPIYLSREAVAIDEARIPVP